MRSITHAFLLFGMCLCCLKQGYGQRVDSVDLISISLRIVGKGTPSYGRDTIPGYFALATLTNTQDTTIHFWVMSCSWPAHNFITSNDSIYFWIPGCDRNIPDKIVLLPHHSVDFYGLFEPSNKKPLPMTVKLGFLYFDSFEDLLDYIVGRNRHQNFNVHWSNSVNIADPLYRYRVN
jgi:hypothetical protein